MFYLWRGILKPIAIQDLKIIIQQYRCSTQPSKIKLFLTEHEKTATKNILIEDCTNGLKLMNLDTHHPLIILLWGNITQLQYEYINFQMEIVKFHYGQKLIGIQFKHG